MPPAVATLLRKFGVLGREEDKLAAYLQLLKAGPRLLRLLPGRRVRDLRHWLSVYAYWNAGGVANVAAMAAYLSTEVLGLLPSEVAADGGASQKEVGSASAAVVPPPDPAPATGLVHPERPGYYFRTPAEYVEWHTAAHPDRAGRPRVAVLLYRKHVVSGLSYINHLVSHFEGAGLTPLPIFINGVEAHMVLRGQLTSAAAEAA
eukprot:contig_46925_g10261